MLDIILWIGGTAVALFIALFVAVVCLVIVWFFWRGDKMDSELPGWYKRLAKSKFGKRVENAVEWILDNIGG